MGPFDFDGDGDIDFGERAFRDEFLSGDLDDEAEDDVWDDGEDLDWD